MKLSHRQKEQFYQDGYVLIPGVVPRLMVNDTLRAINHSVGQGMNVDEMTKFRAQSYCPELTGEPVIADVFNKTPLLPLAESAVGAGKIRPVGGGQIALRFPVPTDPPPVARPHIDGMYSPTNGVPEGTIGHFTALVGVLLSDLPGPDAGNFTVWPGTHRLYEDYFRAHGPEKLFDGMPPIDMPAPVQITGQAGDGVLVHYQLAHGVTPNVSPHVRYALFFRLTHVEHNRGSLDILTDIWREWEGLRDVSGAAVGGG